MKAAVATKPRTAGERRDDAALAYWNRVKHLYPKEKAAEKGYFRAVFAAYCAGADEKKA